MSGFLSMIVLLVPMLCVAAVSTEALAAAAGATPRCQRKCGDMDIPFPFGLNGDDTNCSRMSPLSFNLTCDRTFSPPKVFRGDFEVISISLLQAKARLLLNVSYKCYYNINGGNSYNGVLRNPHLPETFTFSHSENVFTGVGCDTVALFMSQSFETGCMSWCVKSSGYAESECSGIGCCQTAVPKGLREYKASILQDKNHRRLYNFNHCSYSFLVEKSKYTFHVSDLQGLRGKHAFPVVVDWVVGHQNCTEARKDVTYGCVSANGI